MLKWLRKYSRSWFIAIAIGAIAVVFIFWGVGPRSGPGFENVAEVNGEPITRTAYQQQFNELMKQYQERYPGEFTPEIVKTLRLKETALNRLIQEALILQAGERLGLSINDAELRETIQSYPYFQQDGKFDERRYFWLLSRSRIGPQEFESQERRRLLIRKVMDEVNSLAKVSDGELQEAFQMQKEAVAVSYLVVAPEKFLAAQAPKEEEIAKYFQDRQAEFRVPARARVGYLVFRTKDFLGKVKVAAEDVENYINEHSQEYFRPKVIKARQLLLPLAPKATPEERQKAAQQAAAIQQKAQEGEDFEQLVKEHSQDAATKSKGGDLGFVSRGQQGPEWDQVAFALQPGEVGQATTPKGIYLIKVEEVKETERLPDAVAKAGQRLKEDKALALAKEAAEAARADLPGKTVGEVAKKFGVSSQETPLISQRDPVPGLGVLPAFNKAALELKPKEVSRVVDLPEGLAVLQGLEHQADHVPPLAQIKDKVTLAVKKQMAQKKAEEEAARLLNELQAGKSLAQVASQAGLTVKESDYFTRMEGFLKQRQAEALTRAAFQLSKDRVYVSQPLFSQNNYYLLAFKGRREPDPKDLEKERDKLKAQYLQQKRQLFFNSWLDAERQRAKIKIFELP